MTNPSHNAYVSAKRVKIYYKYHALYNSYLRVERVLSKTSSNLIHCELPDGSIAAFPSWMMNLEACAQFSNGAPQVPVDVLQELHDFLREVPKNLATFKSHHKKSRSV